MSYGVLHKLKYRVRLNTNVTALGTLTEKKIICQEYFWNHFNSWEPIYVDIVVAASLCYFVNASIFSFGKITYSSILFFVEDVNSLGSATNEYHVYWANFVPLFFTIVLMCVIDDFYHYISKTVHSM